VATQFRKGQGKVPGSGRPTGSLNRVTVELRALFSQLVNDPEYQRKFRQDFRARRVHPITETKVWEYHAGKPPTELNVNITQRYEAEAELLRGLDLLELEALHAESQALIDRALDRAKQAHIPLHNPLQDKDPPLLLGKRAGSDNGGYVDSEDKPDNTELSPEE
jgi:hypothetical protein